ncbi:antizyme inhibitor 1-like [Balaenoptera ricei]|uniref:antizyme inhibitor 1-like n=1 Tax=Balaenoptera ricei TaxID=2746895 RepID=UPI0028BE0659|nr:antizyme inhibitor 1-like [Balaenoptera ricei]
MNCKDIMDVRERAQEMAERGPFQEAGAEKTKTLRQKQAGVLGNRQEASGMELREEGLQEKRSGQKRQEAAQGGSVDQEPWEPRAAGRGGAEEHRGREHAQRRDPEAVVTGIHGCLMNRSRRLDSPAWAVSMFRVFAFSAFSHPFSLSALRCDEAESSPHPALAFLLLPALLFCFSPSAAATTAAQLVSVPRFSPNVIPAAYGPGRLGYFCSSSALWNTAELKGFIDDASYSVGLLDEGTNLGNVVDNYVYEHTLTGKNAFFVGDFGKIVKKHSQWQNIVAQIKPFYTVKCNSTPAVLEILAALGTGFACSSKTEMALVQELGVSPENIIYISPCKQVSQIKYAAKVGVNIMTCDNEVELKKIARNQPSAKVLLHITTEDNIGGEEGNIKFGTTLKNCRHLLECAKELDVQIIGVKFHVSSACKESQVYVHALSDARCVFDMAGEFGFTMNMLDIGGGFTGTEFRWQEVNHVISPLLDLYFPEGSDVKIISEPGSYYVSSAFTLAVNIIAKKVVENKFSSGVGKTGSDEPTFMYYMNDGVYGCFGSKLSEDLNTIPEVHKKYKEDEPLFTSSLWGPSCDELDQIVENCLLPELNVGDWLIFDNMGADSFHEPSAFNDFQRPAIYYMMSYGDWYEMQDSGITSDTMMKNFFFVPSCIQLSQEDNFFTEA